MLAQAFLEDFAQTDIQFSEKRFSEESLQYLSQQNWSGNVRELRNVVERLVILSADQVISKEDCELFVVKRKTDQGDVGQFIDQYDYFSDFKDEVEKRFIERKLDQYEWNISQTAEAIGIQRSHLYNKMKKFQLQR
jgi:DNA-binding NtrC family response regulator